MVGGQTRFYFYDAEGNPLWGYVPGVGYETFNFFFQGRHLATNNVTNGLLFRHLDHLGSPRLLTTSEGGVFYRMLFHPYGEEAAPCAGAGDRRRFTGKERDAETGLDYFGARYHAASIGRFTSVDRLWQTPDPANSQFWNRYTYGLNNPVRYVDAGGEFPVLVIPLGGAVIGGAWGAVSAWWAEEPIGKGFVSGAFGGVTAAATLPWLPWLSGATAGAVASGMGVLYDRFVEGKTLSAEEMSGSLITGAIGGGLIGGAVGGIVRTPPGYAFKGLLPPRPGRPPHPFRTKKIGVKTWDVYRAYAFSGALSTSYGELTSEMGVSRRLGETSMWTFRRPLEVLSRLTPEEQAQEEVTTRISYIGVLP